MEDIKKYPVLPGWFPDKPQVKKVVSVPGRVIYINLAAAPTANVIMLVQGDSHISNSRF